MQKLIWAITRENSPLQVKAAVCYISLAEEKSLEALLQLVQT